MLQLPSPEDARRLLDFFSESGYTFAGLTARPELKERASRLYGTVPFLLEKTSEPSTFHTLIRWFTIGIAVPSGAARSVVPDWAIDLMIRCGMLAQNGDQIEPFVMMSPLGTMLIASDPVLKWEDDASDLVLWPNPTTEQLFNFTIRKLFTSALDFGCGSGVQALGLASHCEAVFATDVNPRAAALTKFNARLNGLENVACAAGDCFEPSKGRTFDLIVANPPFFVTPSSGLTYCENNLELDLFCRRLAREAPAYLNEGGYFQMVCEWVEVQGQPWRERIAEWVQATGCDAWIIKQYSMSASKYGSERAHQRPPGGEDAFFAEWIAYAHQNRIAAVHGGLVTMRKRSGSNWVRIDDEPISVHSAVGDLILAGFAGRDVLDSTPESALLDLRPRLVSGARLVQMLGQSAGGWNQESLRLHLPAPMSRQIDVDPGVAQFVAQLDGSKRLIEIIEGVAGKAGTLIEQVIPQCVAVTRRLIEKGFLEV